MSNKPQRPTERTVWLSVEAATMIAAALAQIDSHIAHWTLRHLRRADVQELTELSKLIDQAREIALNLRDKKRE